MPVCTVKEVDEIDAQGLLGLAYLPVLTSLVAFQVLAEPAHLVSQGLVRGLARQESSHPAHAVRRSLLLDEPCLEEKLAELLQRSLELAHGGLRALTSTCSAKQMPELEL